MRILINVNYKLLLFQLTSVIFHVRSWAYTYVYIHIQTYTNIHIFHIILLGDSATRPQQVSTGSLRVTIISQEGQSKQEDFDTVRLYW